MLVMEGMPEVLKARVGDLDVAVLLDDQLCTIRRPFRVFADSAGVAAVCQVHRHRGSEGEDVVVAGVTRYAGKGDAFSVGRESVIAQRREPPGGANSGLHLAGKIESVELGVAG